MRMEISMSGMVVGVVDHVGPGTQLALGLRILDDEQPPPPSHDGEGVMLAGSPCACESGRPFEECHGTSEGAS